MVQWSMYPPGMQGTCLSQGLESTAYILSEQGTREEVVADDIRVTHPPACSVPHSLTLHGLDEVPDSIGPDTERCTLLHELGRDVTVCIQVVHCLRIQLH